MSRKLKYICILIIGMVCLSCQHRETYYEFQELKDGKWSKEDTLYFDIDSSAISLHVPFDLEVELVNNADYAYQNIWLYMQDDFAGQSMNKVEKEYQLADNLGKWYGSGFGSLYQLTLGYKKNIIFTEKRNYKIKVVQGMRDEPLYGIEKVGIKLLLSGERTSP